MADVCTSLKRYLSIKTSLPLRNRLKDFGTDKAGVPGYVPGQQPARPLDEVGEYQYRSVGEEGTDLSRRKPGFKPPWDYQTLQLVGWKRLAPFPFRLLRMLQENCSGRESESMQYYNPFR
jgi:hypothetical protein